MPSKRPTTASAAALHTPNKRLRPAPRSAATDQTPTNKSANSGAGHEAADETSDQQQLSPLRIQEIEAMEQENLTTRDGWQLAAGLRHLEANGVLVPLMNKHGFPKFLQEPMPVGAQKSYEELCRIIVGQQLAGAAVKKIWARFKENVPLTPFELLQATESDQKFEALRAAAGLSKAKLNAIVDLSRHFEDERLSDKQLFDQSQSDEMIATLLTDVKGVGPWTARMFLMFVRHRPDLLPLGDLAVRKGIAKVFRLKGSGKSGALDEKKDAALMEEAFEQFKPYRSIATWYMWRVDETEPYDEAMN